MTLQCRRGRVGGVETHRAVLSGRFNPEMLLTARVASGHTQTSLAAAIGVSQGLVGKWEAGLASPAAQHLPPLSEILAVDEGFFFVDRPRRLATLSDFFHRAMARAKVSEVNAIHARCSIFDLQLDRLLQLGTLPDDRIPEINPENHQGNIERVAAMARAAMGVGPGPVKDLIGVIEACGGVVVDRCMEAEDVDALCRWVPGLPKLFFINPSRPADRIRFSLAHELAHTVMHFAKDYDLRLAETQANEFAAAFLMPAAEITRDLRTPLKLEDLAALKRKWRVAMSAIARRARTVGVIDERRYRGLCVQLSSRGWRKTEPVAVDRESPRAFANLIHENLVGGHSRPDLARMLFMSEQAFDALVADYGPAPDAGAYRLRIAR